MKINIIAISFAIIGLALPIAAQAGSDCGIPQGYGTTNPYTFNRSTCGITDNSYHVPNAATDKELVAGSRARRIRPLVMGQPIPTSQTARSNTEGQ